jgi:hypothetical protein
MKKKATRRTYRKRQIIEEPIRIHLIINLNRKETISREEEESAGKAIGRSSTMGVCKQNKTNVHLSVAFQYQKYQQDMRNRIVISKLMKRTEAEPAFIKTNYLVLEPSTFKFIKNVTRK